MAALRRSGARLISSMVATALWASAASAQSPVVGNQQTWQSNACRPDDSRCLALQRGVCDPHNATATDKCAFVRADPRCAADVQRIDYLAMLYCHNAAAAGCALAAWALALFLVMSVAAEAFLCPAMEFLAGWLRMAPDIAGVTLFAFASGAPDLLTQVAALAEGDHVDIELAVSATFGGGLFIICVVLGAVILISGVGGEEPQVPDRLAYVRDACAYLATCVLMLCLLWTGRLTALEGWLLVAAYAAYLALCLATRGDAGAAGAGGGGSVRGAAHWAASPRQPGIQQNGSGAPAAGPREVEMAAVVVAVDEPASPVHQVAVPQRGPPIPLVPAPSNHPDKRLRGRLAAAQLGGGGAGTPRASPPLAAFDGVAGGEPRQQPMSAKPWAPLPFEEWQAVAAGVRRWLQELPAMMDEYLHLCGPPGARRWAAYAAAPLVLAMHATMPALHGGTFGMGYAALLSFCYPPFFLLATGLYPSRLGGGVAGFLAVCASTSVAICTLLYAIPTGPAGGASAPTAGTADGSGPPSPASLPTGALGAPPPLRGADGGPERAAGRRPRRHPFLALLAFAQCIVWLNAAADELVALLEAAGRVWRVRRDVLGATVLAWGEALPDLVAVASLARSGHGAMAIAACFGGPVFNVLVSMGGPIAYVAAGRRAVPYRMTSGVVVLVGSTVVALAFLLAAVPLRYNWALPRGVGAALLAFYAATQLLFLLAEGVVIS